VSKNRPLGWAGGVVTASAQKIGPCINIGAGHGGLDLPQGPEFLCPAKASCWGGGGRELKWGKTSIDYWDIGSRHSLS